MYARYYAVQMKYTIIGTARARMHTCIMAHPFYRLQTPLSRDEKCSYSRGKKWGKMWLDSRENVTFHIYKYVSFASTMVVRTI